uniref:Uncharacterized protein n=1 Tax=Solanum tuberosum TaxID=4113 RepID=M1DT11_SOLTU
MMRGIHLGHSYGLSTLLVGGGAFGVAITTSGVQVKVEHSQFYYSTGKSSSIGSLILIVGVRILSLDYGFACGVDDLAYPC